MSTSQSTTPDAAVVAATPPNNYSRWGVCPTCHGEGKLKRPPSRKARLRHKRTRTALDDALGNANDGDALNHESTITATLSSSAPPPPRIETCSRCTGSGLVVASPRTDDTSTRLTSPVPSTTDDVTTTSQVQLPDIAIIGGGLGGLAFALACRHMGIPCTVYERDSHFDQRSQGYGLTLQQASKAVSGFGLSHANNLAHCTITSTRHVVHTTDGNVVGEWGLRKWGRKATSKTTFLTDSSTTAAEPPPPPKRMNFHIPRQALRRELYQALLHQEGESKDSSTSSSIVQWNHRLLDYSVKQDRVQLRFHVNHADGHDDEQNVGGGDGGKVVERQAALVVGADGIRSMVRKLCIGDEATPLRYLNCLVVLGICPLSNVESSSSLLDGATVFQTADGTTRWYAMPYSSTQCMWQLSFPMTDEAQAKELSQQGPAALQQEARRRCGSWHDPIPQLIDQTPIDLITGYPCYDRDLLTKELLLLRQGPDSTTGGRRVTLVGDAAHPMSPFKGQGANQALLDALSLARAIYKSFRSDKKNEDEKDSDSNDELHCLEQALTWYEDDMLTRSAVKVQASADAAHFLHTDVAICKGNVTRGGANKRQQHSSAVVATAGQSDSAELETTT